MKHLFLHILLLITILSNVHAQRGRVQIQDGTLVTDKGTLLRGCYIGIESSLLMTSIKEELISIKNLGLNTLHVYADCQFPGEQEANIDSIVKWTENDSLYLILTVGWWGGPDLDCITGFWRKFASKYKDKTHVIFEISNEPFEWSAPYDSVTLTMEKRMYDTIRFYAPETHIQFMSYCVNINTDSAIMDIRSLGEGIDWGNASIAAHGYLHSSETTREFIREIQDSGYAISITEVPVIRYQPNSFDLYANLAFIRINEQEFVSYCHLITPKDIIDKPYLFKSKIESSEIRWTPDFGTWPESLTTINYSNPYQPIMPLFYDEGSGAGDELSEFSLTAIKANGHFAYYHLDFKEGADSLIIECSSVSDNTVIEVRLDSLEGSLVGMFQLNYDGWVNIKKYTCPITTFEGVHKIYFVFKTNWNYAITNLKSIVFKEKGVNAVAYTSEECQSTLFPTDAIAGAYASSCGYEGDVAERTIDGDMNTRWLSGWTDKEWITLDLGKEKLITGATLYWSWAYPKAYSLEVSRDSENWVTVYSTIYCDGGVDSISNLAEYGRYVRMLGHFLDSWNFWGYSLYEFEVYTCNAITGIPPTKQDKANSILFYPNPAHSYIQVKATEPVNVEIYSMQGQLLIAKKISSEDDQILVSNLLTGSYILKTSNETEIYSEILIIE